MEPQHKAIFAWLDWILLSPFHFPQITGRRLQGTWQLAKVISAPHKT
jgi:hypothetical protein